MSTLRPTLGCNLKGYPCMTNGTAYFMILQAVRQQPGLVHGKLHQNGRHCAIGSYFAINNRTALPTVLIDEVASVNDSMPQLTPLQRKREMLNWLRWKCASLGMKVLVRRKLVPR